MDGIKVQQHPSHRYGGWLMLLHWLTAALVFAVVPVAWVVFAIPESAHAAREQWFTVHKSLGLLILLLAVVRLGVRLTGGTPSYPRGVSRSQLRVAWANHVLLYATLFLMPVTGYVLLYASGHPFPWFWLFTVPDLVPHNEALAHVSARLHLLGQWVVYALVALHVVGALHHLVVRRDGVFLRMLPMQRWEEAHDLDGTHRGG